MDELLFGFLPVAVLQNVTELGNWKTRAHGIEQVQQGLASLGPAQKQEFLRQLPQFVQFIQQLLQDHNFKVVTAGLDALAGAARHAGTALQAHMGSVLPILLEKLLDHRDPIAAAAVRTASVLMQHAQSADLANKLLQLWSQQSPSAADLAGQDSSALVEVLILAMLRGPVSSLDMPAAARLLLACLQHKRSSGSAGSSPRSSKARALALEALAVATDSLGAQLPNLVKQAGGTDLTVTDILTQVQHLQRPALAADGSIRHNSTVLAAIAAVEAAAPVGSSFRTGSHLYDMTSNSSAASFRSDSSLGFSTAKAAVTSGKGGLDSTADADACLSIFTRPVSASASQQQQLLPPGSLGAFAAHARLISSANSAMAAASGGGSSSSIGCRPPAGSNQATAATLGRKAGTAACCRCLAAAASAVTGVRLSSHTMLCHLPLAAPVGCSAVAAPVGSLAAAALPPPHSFSHLQPGSALVQGQDAGSSLLQEPLHYSQRSSNNPRDSAGTLNSLPSSQQPCSHAFPSQQAHQVQSQLHQLQLYDSSRYTPSRQDSQPPQDAAAGEASAAEAAKAGHLAADSTTSSLGNVSKVLPVGLQLAGVLGAAPNLRYHQPGSTGGSGIQPRRSSTDHAPAGEGADQWHCSAYVGAANAAGDGVSTKDTGSTAASAWPPVLFTSSDPASVPCCSGRSETLSPNRGERLAFLKRRQVEKRAASATGSTRSSFPWDSQDSTLTAAAAAGGTDTAPAGSPGPVEVLPRASTAGPAPGAATGWRSASSGSQMSGGGGAHAAAQGPYGVSISPVPSEEHEHSSPSGTRAAPLLHWHIPTGPGGRVLPPGSGNACQRQQQQQQHYQCSSPEPSTAASKGLGVSFPTNSWDSGSTAGGRAYHSSAGVAGGAAGLGAAQLLEGVPRTSSAAAVLSAAAADGCSLGGSLDSSSMAASSSLQGRNSRFQQPRSGSCSPATAGAEFGGSSSAQFTSSRLHSSGNSIGSGSGPGCSRPPMQQSSGLRAQTAFAGSLASQRACVHSASGAGSCSSPVSQLGSTCGPLGSGLSDGSAIAGLGQGSVAGGATSPSRSPGGIGSRAGSGARGSLPGDRPHSVGMAEMDMAASDLSPVPDPEAVLRQAVARLQQANAATRKEVDWQAQLDALIDARRLLAHHAEVLRPSARELVLAALPAVDDLRSTTSRMALLFFQELPAAGLSLDRELDEVVPMLLKKAGDLSTAGRDNFLAQEASQALSLMCTAVSPSKALCALIAAGASHKSPHVRSKAAAHLDELAAGGKGLESGNWAVLDKVFKTAAGFLQEGSLDTRTYGKRLLWAVKSVLNNNRPDMDRLMSGITPEGVHRRVAEVLEGLAAPPPPPSSRLTSSAGPRAASRGTASGCSTPTSALQTGLQPTAPFSAPPASMFMASRPGADGMDGSSTTTRQGYSSVGSTSGNSNSSVARRSLFSGGGSSSSNTTPGLQVQGSAAAAAASASPGSPAPSSSAGRRHRSTASGAIDGGKGPKSPSTSGGGSAACAAGVSAYAGSNDGSSERRLSGGCPAGPPGPMSPELQEAVEQVGLQLGSKDWRNRMDALRALSTLCPALPEVPNTALEGLLQALVERLSDGNAKVNQKALEVLCEVLYIVNLRTLLVMPSLVPAITANLGSTNDKLRSYASTALDAVTNAVLSQPQLLIQGLAQAVANGSVRTKVAVIEKLGVLLPHLHQTQPQLTRLLLPAAFSLALEGRGDARAAAAQLLSALAACLGSPALLTAAAVVSTATEQRVRELLLGGAGLGARRTSSRLSVQP